MLEDGAIVEVGSHDDLRRAGGRYAAPWDAFEQHHDATGLAAAGSPSRP